MILQAVLNGILFGGVYVCIGIGFSLVWGVMNIINLATDPSSCWGLHHLHALYLFEDRPFLDPPCFHDCPLFYRYASQKYLLNYIIRASIFITSPLLLGSRY